MGRERVVSRERERCELGESVDRIGCECGKERE